ncbi:hypothetical protein ACF08M_38785 [Streptomyces sp. NPDC015032]|uniref:hypothetical protein n=1 Tax=Streptomyces sp. NPDC015032 TaxID=3364937 RepID=UPI0036F9B8E6
MSADVHQSAGHLCARCWAFGPRGRNEWLRAASALCIALGLPKREWHESGFRNGWLQETAQRHRITAWVDAGRTDQPTVAFGWLAKDVLTAACADLEAMEAELQRSRVRPATHR